jgi:hypothetical protein
MSDTRLRLLTPAPVTPGLRLRAPDIRLRPSARASGRWRLASGVRHPAPGIRRSGARVRPASNRADVPAPSHRSDGSVDRNSSLAVRAAGAGGSEDHASRRHLGRISGPSDEFVFGRLPASRRRESDGRGCPGTVSRAPVAPSRARPRTSRRAPDGRSRQRSAVGQPPHAPDGWPASTGQTTLDERAPSTHPPSGPPPTRACGSVGPLSAASGRGRSECRAGGRSVESRRHVRRRG